MNRFCLKIVGESGSGLLSTGDIIAKALKSHGYYINTDREYPSLIKGGQSVYTINLSDQPIYSLAQKTDIMLGFDKESIEKYFEEIKKGGLLVHGYERDSKQGYGQGLHDIQALAKGKKIGIMDIEPKQIAYKHGGNFLMANVVLIGFMWKVLGLEFSTIKKFVEAQFAHKKKFIDINIKCLEEGYKIGTAKIKLAKVQKHRTKKLFINGNEAIALGAIHAGMRAYFAYPMSPASSILTYVAKTAEQTGIAVKQAEDEITAAQLSLGAMHVGTRAMVATSGGGYDLMTETVSLAGMIECPLVVVIAQRPGPATGLPTWTSQGDLNLAIYSSHGEFARIVIAVSNPEDAFSLTQEALNLAEEYQSPVIILTEKVIAESHYTIDNFRQKQIKIKRGLVPTKELNSLKSSDRFELTQSGISKRWLPGSSETHYFANGDEHLEDGSLTEDSAPSKAIYEKRMRKLETITKALPDPQILGVTKNADISFIGWGSTKNNMLDIIELYKKKKVKVNYLHFSYLFPLKTKTLEKFFKENKNVHLAEMNYQGQLGQLIEQETSSQFQSKFLKYDGRPFFVEDFETYIKKNL